MLESGKILKKFLALFSMSLMLALATTTFLVTANPVWGRTPPTPNGGSIGHVNPALSQGRIYPGPDDCGFLNGEAEPGSQHQLPDAVPFIQFTPNP